MTEDGGSATSAFRLRAADFLRPSSFVLRPSSFPPWHLPHLLGLDAPLVAVIWQLWWARWLAVELGWIHHVVLALAVWMIYLADRLADAARLRPAPDAAEISARHRFAWRHRQALATLLLGVICALAVLTPLWLTAGEFRRGCALLAVQAAYFGLIHLWASSARGGRSLPAGGLPGWSKEAWVGASFAIGTSWFPAWAGGKHVSPGVVVALVCWSMVCFLNCALISLWEQDWPAFAGDTEPGQWLGTFCAGIAASSAAVGPILGSIMWPVALAAAGLWWLEGCRRRGWLTRETRRVLADVVLLAPLPVLLLI